MFKLARPIFARGKDKEMNYPLILRAQADSLQGAVLYLTAYSFYRLTVNGEFVSFGPARTASGYARVDAIDLDRYHRGDVKNEITIEVSGYYCKALSTCLQPSFVIAELRRGDDVLLCTGRDFLGYRSARKIQKTERFSVQRHFVEVWDLRDTAVDEPVELEVSEVTPKYLQRVAPYANTEVVAVQGYFGRGEYVCNKDAEIPRRYSFVPAEAWGIYGDGETEHSPHAWISRHNAGKIGAGGDLPCDISEGEYAVIDLGVMECGFIGFGAYAHEETDLIVGFSESCTEEDFRFTNINMRSSIECFLECGKHTEFESFEPYTCRTAIVMVKSGSITLDSFFVRKFEFGGELLPEKSISDPELKEISNAAIRTFLHNAVDIYMDCPSRERAGWLCDSYFIGRTEYFLTGKSAVEDAFLENYRLYVNGGEYPVGVLPMCYPSDPELKQKFIPQWNMWYVLEVGEYLTQRNKGIDRELFRSSVYGVLNFLEKYENGDGLLQNLPNWNFVEWSAANDWINDVNYPTNFLYAEVLRTIGKLYGEPELVKKGDRVAELTSRLSFDGELFIDNAVADERGIMRNTRNSSEAGQYYAILFGNIDINEHKYSRLREYVLNGFEVLDLSGREFVCVNAFIGFYLRLMTLMKLDERELLAKDVKSFFGRMTSLTGTLWEYKLGAPTGEIDTYAAKRVRGSCDHGFASFAAVAIDFIEN